VCYHQAWRNGFAEGNKSSGSFAAGRRFGEAEAAELFKTAREEMAFVAEQLRVERERSDRLALQLKSSLLALESLGWVPRHEEVQVISGSNAAITEFRHRFFTEEFFTDAQITDAQMDSWIFPEQVEERTEDTKASKKENTKKAATPDERKAATSGEKEIEEKKGPAQPLEDDAHKSSDALLSFLLLVAFLWLLRNLPRTNSTY
jgi:hypothetical protein